MALHPPSFFQNVKKDDAQQVSHSTAVPPPSPNATLHHPTCTTSRYQQDSPHVHGLSQSSTMQCPSGAHVGGTSHLLSPSLQPAVLANDLLQVEVHLQSKVRLLETEKRELSMQVLEMERALVEQRKQCQDEREALVAQHEKKLSQVQVENERLSGEYSSYRTESEGRVVQLEEELAAANKQHTADLEVLQSRVAELEACNANLTSDLNHQCQTHEEEMNEMRSELSKMATDSQLLRQELEKQIEVLNTDLTQKCQKIHELESYLGGEIPAPSSGGEGGEGRMMTWKEEREHLYNTIRNHESDLQRLQSEDKLLNIRLSSMTEILNIQEADIAKQYSTGSEATGCRREDSSAAVRSLLSRWREKVFVLLVQQRLQEMQVTRDRHEAEKREVALMEQVEQLTREKEILGHSLTDRTAELQRQANKIQATDESLAEAYSTIDDLHAQLAAQHESLTHLGTCARTMSETHDCYKSTFNQALTRIANFEQRLGFATRRLNSLKATLVCHYAIVQSYTQASVTVVESGCQTSSEDTQIHQGSDLTSYSREQLVQEVRCLSRERDGLASQLQEGTDAFQKQIQTLTQSHDSKLAKVESQLRMVQQDKDSIEHQLSELQHEHGTIVEQRQGLSDRVEQLEKELRDTQATVESRVESAVSEEQGRSNEAMAEMEKLLNVARREHAKAVVQLQQLQRQLARDRDRAVEAVELSKARLEHELESCRKKLQATQVERNLLLTTLRQEGLVPPAKRASPRKPTRLEDDKSELMLNPPDSDGANNSMTDTSLQGSETAPSERSTSISSSREDSKLESDEDQCLQEETPSHLHHHASQESTQRDILTHPTRRERTPELSKPTNLDEEDPLPFHAVDGQQQPASQDIRSVLKDLQMLSASLLGMDANT